MPATVASYQPQVAQSTNLLTYSAIQPGARWHMPGGTNLVSGLRPCFKCGKVGQELP